jgi:dUTP pyrophosphatase
MNNKIEIKKLRSDAVVPTRGSNKAAGLDLYAVSVAEIAPNSRTIVPTGIAISIPDTVYARIAPRSGLAAKNGINVLAGVVDSDYRGEIKVILHNTGSDRFIVNPGDRIAQLILEKIIIPEVVLVDTLDNTTRGADGFGSTGA